MASTLITRIGKHWLLDPADAASVMAEKGIADESDLGLALHATMGVAQEVVAGRMLATVMDDWLTVAERVDADAIIAKVVAGDFTLDEVERMLKLVEGEIYTPAQVETILGLT